MPLRLLIKLAGIIFATFLCFGCTMTAHLYSTDGHIQPVYFSYAADGNGRVWGTLPTGEAFEGDYFTVINDASAYSRMTTPWGPITVVTRSEIGPQVSYITAAGKEGGLIQCISFPRGAHGVGGCRDFKGREYRLHY
jgi:hypothetical protein